GLHARRHGRRSARRGSRRRLGPGRASDDRRCSRRPPSRGNPRTGLRGAACAGSPRESPVEADGQRTSVPSAYASLPAVSRFTFPHGLPRPGVNPFPPGIASRAPCELLATRPQARTAGAGTPASSPCRLGGPSFGPSCVSVTRSLRELPVHDFGWIVQSRGDVLRAGGGIFTKQKKKAMAESPFADY